MRRPQARRHALFLVRDRRPISQTDALPLKFGEHSDNHFGRNARSGFAVLVVVLHSVMRRRIGDGSHRDERNPVHMAHMRHAGGFHVGRQRSEFGVYIVSLFALDELLAATNGISVDFSSSGYLDVSVPRVASAGPMCSGQSNRALPRLGSPIRSPRSLTHF